MNWRDRTAPVSKYFTVKELIWLPRWSRLANSEDGLTDEVKASLIDLAYHMDVVREFLDEAILIHCTYRPREYNALVGGAPDSAHIYGMAMDFSVDEISCDEVRELIVPALLSFDLYCENRPGSDWVHLSRRRPASGDRFFTP